MPSMIEDLHFTKAQLGVLGSVLYIAYGISKFVSGVVSDRSNPRVFMAAGLILTGVMNILFGMSSSIYLFGFFWALNGLFQGWGWPACTKQLTFWFSRSERGFWWSLKSTSHNVGGALIPILVALISAKFGWRWALYLPGAASIVMGVLLLERLRDVPQSLGLPSVEEYKKESITEATTNIDEQNERVLSVREILFSQVLNNKAVWVLAFSYFFVYVVRTAINDWGSLYLHSEKGYSLIEAASSIFWFEVGGFLGCIASGWSSDYFFQGKRVPFMVLCAIGLVFSVSLFWNYDGTNIILEHILISVIGFLIFGPQMLVGLAAAEFVDKKAACTANGFAGCFAYIGAAVTGYPLGKIIDTWGWKGFFVCLVVCSVMLMMMLTPLLKFGRKRENVIDCNLEVTEA